MRTVAFLNKKGGVGKTSTCHHVAGVFPGKGLRVLLVDSDPQASLSQGLLGPEATRALNPARTIASLFDEAGGPSLADLILPTPVPGVSILPGSEAAEDLNVTRPGETGPLQYTLRDALAEVADQYDIALVDCPPNVQLCSWAALVAADGVVIPLQAEDYGSQGVVAIQASIRRVQRGPNPGLVTLGYLITMYNKSLGVHIAYEADLRQIYGDLVFTNVVPLAKDFKEAVMARKPVSLFRPKAAAAKATAALADELLSRIARIESQGEAA
jgi:chromosome partitioning protein